MTQPELHISATVSTSEPLFERLFESSPDGILVADGHGRIVRANGQAERMFGYQRGELHGQPIEVLVPERFRDTHAFFRRDYIAKLRMSPGNVSVESFARRSDRTEFPAEITVTNVVEAAEGPLVLAVVRDISERKRAGEALREFQDFLANITNAISDPVFVKDEQHRWVTMNDALCNFIQRRREELTGKTDYDFFPKEEADAYWANDRMVLETGQKNVTEEVVTDAQGTTHVVVTKKALYTAADGKKFIVGVVGDITEHKRADEALQERERLLQSILDNSPATIYIKDLEGRYLKVNRHCAEALGASEQQILGKVVHDFFPKALADRIQAHEQEVLEKRSAMQFEDLIPRKDGLHTALAIKFPLFDSAGSPHAIGGISTDITERKRAEEALRQREELLESILDNTTAVIYVKDREGRLLRVNRQYEKLFGIAKEQVVGKTDYDLFPKDKADAWRTNDLKVLETGNSMEFEEVVPQEDGLHTYISIKFPIYGSSGIPSAVGGISTDITERKRTEAALLLEMTNVLVSNLDPQKLFAAVSASIRKIVEHDYATLLLYDPETNRMRVHRLTTPSHGEPLQGEYFLPVEGSPGGFVFSTREPVVMNRMELDRFPAMAMRHSELLQRWIDRGVKSVCWLPLVHGENALGVLIVAIEREDAFPEQAVRLLTQVTSQIAVALDNALAYRQIADAMDRLAQEKRYLEDELKTEFNFEEIIGESAPLKRVLKKAETVAPADATVLILGETGTGKELIARAIHNLSPRRGHTFVKLNCAAIPAGLLESELFGHEKGAFTGAIARKIGRLEVANGGTLLLDEIGDIPLELQPKLLRALQEKEFERVGSTRTIPADVRVIAATNRDLAEMVKDGRFRRDLFYRLSVFPITLPPLRERTDDIPLLVHYFLQKHATRTDKRIKTVPPEIMQALVRWHWPGNVREMENVIERAVILSQGPELRVPLSEFTVEDSSTPLPSQAGSSTLEDVEREHILRVLRETNGVIAGEEGAAAKLGLKRTTLNFRMRKLGIDRKDL